jgi:hypothetical protein
MPPRRQLTEEEEKEAEWMRSVRHVVRCKGHTKTGRRCKRRTAKTSLCHSHLESEEHLMITKSQIHKAGLGLYTTIPRRKNQQVTEYSGKKVFSDDPDFGGAYVLQINDGEYIDARKTTTAAGRFSNNARRGDGYKNNAHLSVSRRYKTANIVMSNNVPNATK